MTSGDILVTGADGLVGRALRRVLPGASFRARATLDVTDEAAVYAATKGMRIVVHAAALRDVETCERDPEAAAAVNTGGTRNVVAAAREHGVRVIFLSTDYVFSGDAAPYDEEAIAAPVNVYGRTKLAAEEHLDEDRDLTVRTSRVFGDGRNFVRTILQAAAWGPVRVVDDQFGRPTSASGLTRALAEVVERPDLVGRLHLAGSGPPCSWADLAEAALCSAGLDVHVDRLDSSTYAALAGRVSARRPRDSTLLLTRAVRYGLPLEDWRASLDAYVRGIS